MFVQVTISFGRTSLSHRFRSSSEGSALEDATITKVKLEARVTETAAETKASTEETSRKMTDFVILEIYWLKMAIFELHYPTTPSYNTCWYKHFLSI